MPPILKGLLTFVFAPALAALTILLIVVASGHASYVGVGALCGALFGLLYSLEAGILTIYDLSSSLGWVQLIVDMTWSLPNTVFGFVVGNLFYWFFGSPSRADSENAGWIVFTPYGGSGFGTNVLQTLGTVNLGGAGQHERMHLLQARVFGPLYLPIFAVNYVITFLIQVLWTFTLGGVLWLTNIREKPYFRPPQNCAIGGSPGASAVAKFSVTA